MDSTVTLAFQAALPADPRVETKKMFGTPCAFVNRQMFFGVFEETLVARVGPARAQELIGTDGITAFTPTIGRTWFDYVQLDGGADPTKLGALAVEALAWAAALPGKTKLSRANKKARKK